jgi:CRP-like cAMP-binding protein
MALVTGEQRTATVRSVGETVIYEISRQLYEPLLRAHPEWLDELTAVMRDRLALRAARLAGGDPACSSPPLLQRIRRALFG